MSSPRRPTTSCGRPPYNRCTSATALTAAGSSGSTASMSPSGTGRTRGFSLAADLPSLSPLTSFSAAWTPTGTNSSSTAQAKSRLSRPTCLLTYRRASPLWSCFAFQAGSPVAGSRTTLPVSGSRTIWRRTTLWSTIACRAAFSRLGENSTAGVEPYRRRRNRRAWRIVSCSDVGLPPLT
jgi:hypothetical protein